MGLDGILCGAPERIDSLIATGDIPPMIGVYLQPGVVYAPDSTPDERKVLRWNRSNEFDAPDGRFARFLETELLPAVRTTRTAAGDSIKLLDGPENAMIFGLSSGGICAFNVAWQRPDLFGRIYSGCGTFVPMRGADELQSLVRKTEPAPVKVFLQDGYTDTWNPLFGSWYEANRLLASALEFAGYDCAFDWAEGGHSVVRTSAIFPEVMKWMWSDYAAAPDKPLAPISAGSSGNGTLAPILDGAGQWEAVTGIEASRYITDTLDNRAGECILPEATYPGGAHVAVAVPGSNYLWQYLINAEGKRYAGQPFYWLHAPENRTLRIADMTFDGDGMLWVVTDAGLQICDQNGRVRAIIRLPQDIATALTDSREAPFRGRLAITEDAVFLTTPTVTYRRYLRVAPAGDTAPRSQGPA